MNSEGCGWQGRGLLDVLHQYLDGGTHMDYEQRQGREMCQ
jgi:hypothetical protein